MASWRVRLAAAAFNVGHPCPRCGSWGTDRFLAFLSLAAGVHLAWPWWDTLGGLPASPGMRVIMGDPGWAAAFGGGAMLVMDGMACGWSRVRWAGALVLTGAWASASLAFILTGPQYLGAPVFSAIALAQASVGIRSTRSALWSRPGNT